MVLELGRGWVFILKRWKCFVMIINEVLGGAIRRRSVIILRIVRWRVCFDVKVKE